MIQEDVSTGVAALDRILINSFRFTLCLQYQCGTKYRQMKRIGHRLQYWSKHYCACAIVLKTELTLIHVLERNVKGL